MKYRSLTRIYMCILHGRSLCHTDPLFPVEHFSIKWSSRYEAKSLDHKTKFTDLHNTGGSRYADFAYLDTITYAEVIFHSQHFFSMYLCISTPSMSKTVNMKQWVHVHVSRGDFSCPRVFSITFATAYVEIKNQLLQGRCIVCFGYVYALPQVRKSSK